MKKILTTLLMGLFMLVAQAQTIMNTYQNNGAVLKLPIAIIDSQTFTSTPPPAKLNIFLYGGGIIEVVLPNIDSITYIASSNTLGLPILSTLPVGNIQATSAVSGGNIVNDGGNPVTLRGVCWNTSGNPTIANSKTTNGGGSGNYSSNISGLSPGAIYYVRAYATNVSGTAYGNEWQFTTSSGAGSITALNCGGASNSGTLTAGTAASGVSSSIPYTGGNGGTYSGQTVNSTGVTGLTATLAAGSFNSGSGSLNYTITGTPANSGIANFALNIGGKSCTLSRTVSIANSGTTHTCGAVDVHNPSLSYGSMTDQEGNVYKTILIGDQEWMAENLKVTKYRNGEPIQNVIDNNIWSNITSGAWCSYNNNAANECPYGKLYNWYTVADSRNICPIGWHVPSDAEWTLLADYLGGTSVAGGKMKSIALTYWQSPNNGATNESGFSGLPAADRRNDGSFIGIGLGTFFWSSTENGNTNAWARGLGSGVSTFNRTNGLKNSGLSARCLKDNSLQGSIQQLDCGDASNSGTLTAGTSASGVSSSIPYTGGNGGTHSGQTATSTGVTGLAATLTAGSFNTGSGSLNYTITGTPSTSGTASFTLTIGGQTCTLSRTVNAPAGSITALNCSSASNSGTLTAGTATSGVSSSIPYTGGNGGTHIGQTVTSTGVTGLTATLVAGSFNSGSGSLTYTVTGTPATSGTASFALNIGGQACMLIRAVNSVSGITSHTCGAINTHNILLGYGNMADQEGNVYKTIQVGGQEWMAENLNATKYSNGDFIPNVIDNDSWWNLTNGAWCSIQNDATNNCPYGKLYNWYAVADSRNICPTGWHVPTDTEWSILTNYLGGESLAGGKIKSAGLTYWQSPNSSATNESGLSGLPSGIRINTGFVGFGSVGFWWSSSENNINNAWIRRLDASSSNLNRITNAKQQGSSVRCIKDNSLQGSIQQLNCDSSNNTGLLTAGVITSGASSSILYLGGNGGLFIGQSVSSTGVTGLTATLAPGSFNSGSGLLTYTITGTPAASGTARFAINIGGKSCTLSRTVNAAAGSITALNCGNTNNSGTLTAGTSANGVSSSIPYTGGNGGTHSGQTVNSTGVIGLTATLVAGSFNTGSGSLTYTITGTPATSGTASFALSIGGQNCTLIRTVNASIGITSHTCGAPNVHNSSLSYGSVTDIDGNIYKTIQIGSQEWMAENLKVTRYRNGDSIPNVTDSISWVNLTSGVWCNYNNNAVNDCPYGKLYNWYAVSDNRNICPTGWHVPTDTEWSILINFLGGETSAGSKMKSTGLNYWQSPNTGATNESGFSGLPSGSRAASTASFLNIGRYGGFWSSTENTAGNAWERWLVSQGGDVGRSFGSKRNGMSCRCLRD